MGRDELLMRALMLTRAGVGFGTLAQRGGACARQVVPQKLTPGIDASNVSIWPEADRLLLGDHHEKKTLSHGTKRLISVEYGR